MFQDWDPFPIPPPCEELRVVFDLEEADDGKGRGLGDAPCQLVHVVNPKQGMLGGFRMLVTTNGGGGAVRW